MKPLIYICKQTEENICIIVSWVQLVVLEEREMMMLPRTEA